MTSDALRVAARLAFRLRCRLIRRAARELLVLAKALEQQPPANPHKGH